MKTYLFRGAFLALLFFAFPLGADEAELPTLEVMTLDTPGFEGPQYVGSDSKGRVFLLQTEGKLSVYQLGKDGFGKPKRLQKAAMERPSFVLDAAMNRHGDWLVLYGTEVRLFKGGKEVVLPSLSWQPISVALLDGEPVAATLPFPMGRMQKNERRNPPLLVAADKDDWRKIAESDLREPPDFDERTKERQRRAGRLMADSEDTLWFAHQYRYRIARYSSAGRELLSIEVDGAEVAHRGEEDLEDARVELEEKRAQYANPERANIVVNTAMTSILDLTEGRDGKLYILTKGGAGGTLTLDRYDGVLGTLERVALGVSTPGAVSMASGKDGLYLVPFNGERDGHIVAWEEIDQAEWVNVAGVKINGLEAVPVESAE